MSINILKIVGNRVIISFITLLFTTLLLNQAIDASAQITDCKVKDVTCKGENDGSITATVSGSNNIFYWLYPDNSVKKTPTGYISGLKTGSYTLLVVNNGTCFAVKEGISVGKESCPPPFIPIPIPIPPFWFPVFRPSDPNDITGPAGYGPEKWVSVNDVLDYKIRFENDPKIATSAVNKVIVTHPIDKMADMFSFRLGDINFRNFAVQVPSNSAYFSKRLNLADSIGVIIDITAGLDVTKNQATWIFQAFDPTTGLPNLNPYVGFLEVNDSITHKGEGNVSFSIKPKITANSGDTIHAYADIVFDFNDPLRTNTELNTIDAHPPFSKVKSILNIDQNNLKISWTGQDDNGGCGILNYNLLMSTNNGPYINQALNLNDTSIVLNPPYGNNYKFMTIAIDNVGNKESEKPDPDTIITVLPKTFFISPNHISKYCLGSNLNVRWENIDDINNFFLQISADSGKTFSTIGQNITILDSIFSWNIPKNLAANKYYSIRAVNSVNQLPIDTSDYFLIKNTISVNAGNNKYICEKDSVMLGGSPTASNGIEPYIIEWESYNSLSSVSSSNPYAKEYGEYIVNVTDLNGCSNSDTVFVTSNPLPFVSINGLDSLYCQNSLNDTIVGYPEGGLFTGTGILGNIFDPSTGVGTYQIIYSYTDNNGCSNSTSQSVKVNEPPIVSFTGLNSTYCLNSDTVKLTGIPVGGTFSGDGIIDSLFVPVIAGVGTHQITYSYSDQGGCSNTQTQTVDVIDLSSITIIGLNASYCINADTVDLAGLPTGGIFTGDGVISNKFIPAVAGVGIHQITYSYIDQNGGCSNSKTQQAEVVGLPTVTISGLDTTYCLSANPVSLTGIPADGVFSGNGITGNSFNPSLAGIGSHSITYTYTDPNGCSNSKVDTVKVNGTPNVSFTGLNPSYCLNSGAVTLVGSPIGGTFTGNGILGNSFNPSVAGAGTHQLTYTFTDQNTCLGKQSQSVVVNSLPSVSFSGLDTSYCVNSGLINLTGNPSGGIFSGNGITGSTFNTSIAGIGNHSISYSYTDNIGCSNDTSKSVKVNPLPSIYLGRDTSITTVEAITLDAGSGYTNYSWSDGSTGQTLTLDGAILGKGTHKVWVEVSDDNSCTVADTIQVEVTDNVGIDMFSSKVKLQVYPNPSFGLFNLEIENSSSENIYVEIRNNAGQLVYSKKFKGRYEDIKTEINLGGFAKGVYYINVKVKRERVTRKIVII